MSVFCPLEATRLKESFANKMLDLIPILCNEPSEDRPDRKSDNVLPAKLPIAHNNFRLIQQ